MNFELPADLQEYIAKLDKFIETQILPLQHKDDNNRFFDHRREPSRTQWDNGGLPAPEWEALLAQARRLADDAGFLRFPLPREYGGGGHADTNLWMCALRHHMAAHPAYGGGVGLANDLQSEHSVVGNFPDVLMLRHWGTAAQRAELIPARLAGAFRMTFGLTEAGHGSDATHMAARAAACALPGPDGAPGYRIDAEKMWQTGAHAATHFLVFARTSGRAGSPRGITAFIVPRDTPGVAVGPFAYTLNMPTDHATVRLDGALVPASAVLGRVGDGLAVAQTFTHENRIRQAASSCGAARFCVARSVARARARLVFGRPLAANQAVQWPLVELATQAEMLRLLVLRTAAEMDAVQREHEHEGGGGGDARVPPWVAIERRLGHKISMCNYYANRLATQAADNAIQVHGADGYSRHQPFEHIWRHFRRYRITEGSEEVQMRRVAGYLFGYKSTAVDPAAKPEADESTPKL
ncbi:putative acyl- dehydrogenase [Rosellinia necatrix]|uniref:Putative acyl-dehydrogenase n=1 Tax=Rosellinia necatrix TaxID=77044 RepID=A0A1S7UP14_ROSNE|nr:putative acyl- dehydrogenase [Rosellinia necatrix]